MHLYKKEKSDGPKTINVSVPMAGHVPILGQTVC